MRVGIYNELIAPNAIGGSEFFSATLAAELRHAHQVEIINHNPFFTIGYLSRHSGIDLDGVRHRHLPRSTLPAESEKNPWVKFRRAWSWHAEVSEGYDLFINLTHNLPPFCHAPRGVLIVLFPFAIPACAAIEQAGVADIRRQVRRAYHDWEWRKRLGSYQLKTTISQFTQIWAKRLWYADCPILYPPCDPFVVAGNKRNSILSVGRFSTEWHTKKQMEMVRIFARLRAEELSGLEYACVGGLIESRLDDSAYFEQVRELGDSVGARVVANLDREQLRSLYGRTKVFWHATGLDVKESEHPELAEHFGIAIVDAMSGGCVPIAMNKGGPVEIIRHGVDGFLCDTVEDFHTYTRQLITNEPLFREMSLAARCRAADFSRERFLERWHYLIVSTFPDWPSTSARNTAALKSSVPEHQAQSAA